MREVKNNQAVQGNHVYVIPPDTNLSIDQGILKLQPRPRTRTPRKQLSVRVRTNDRNVRNGSGQFLERWVAM